jgi:GrpB-like predicted nucleotidyltransferase (UPF0157 family)
VTAEGARRVVIVAYDPQWPRLFELESQRVTEALGETAVGVEHIGSTAVDGLPAKPIIDMLAGLRTLDLPTGAIAGMEELGYEFLGEHGILGRLFFRKGRPATHHVHAVLDGSDLWERHLAFRDYLRAHVHEQEQYAAFKRNLVYEVGGEWDRYVEGKEQYADALERRARSWRRALGSVGT